MRIGIDISQIAHKGSGVARYTRQLVESLIEYDKTNDYVFFFSSLRQNPPEDLARLIKKDHALKRLRIPPTLLSYMWNTLHMIPIETYVGKLDIFLSSDWAQPPVKEARSLTVVHDLVMYVHPETSTTSTSIDLKTMNIRPNIVQTHKSRLKWVAQEVDHIIADSESTQKDIVKYLAIPNERISVIYPSVLSYDISEERSKKIIAEYNLLRPYILSVGKLEPRKNIPNLIEAFITSGLARTSELVIVGADGWGDFDITIPDDIRSHIHLLGYISDEHLFALYKSAHIFAYPSVYEGFGYPVIEAMSVGCPVATSNISSLAELADGYAHLFKPDDIQDIGRVLKSMMDDHSFRRKYINKAQKYAESFSQKRFAQELIKIFNTAL